MRRFRCGTVGRRAGNFKSAALSGIRLGTIIDTEDDSKNIARLQWKPFFDDTHYHYKIRTKSPDK